MHICIKQLPKEESFIKYKLFSYVKSISLWSVLVSIFFVGIALWNKFGFSSDYVLLILLFSTLIVLAFIDLEYKAVPDYLLLLALILAFVVNYNDFFDAIKNAAIFAGFFALLEFVGTFYLQNVKYYFTKDESLKDARSLGEGDIPIVAIIGAILGIKAGLVAIFLAAIFAIIPSLCNRLKHNESETPFIPYLLLGLTVEYFFEITKVFN